MPRIHGTNDHQSSFLRAFRTHPAGPPPELWPSPAILRRWLRRPAFRAALASVQAALQFQTDFLIASAASNAARALDPAAATSADAHRLAELLRLAHLRNRCPVQSPLGSDEDSADRADDPPPAPPSPRELLSKIPPERRLSEEEFHKLAVQRHYHPPLRTWPHFPVPVPQDTFYYKLVQNPAALLWYMKLYQTDTRDYRYSPILLHCERLLEDDDNPHLPRFASASSDVSAEGAPLLCEQGLGR